MTQNSKTTHAGASTRTPASSGHRLNLQVLLDGVVAGYIHKISQRHHDGGRRADESCRRRPWLLEGASWT
jgi:hypothetical protein